ncbi:DUF1800 family protein [Pseudoxanthomonas mexicana]|nr:DUF1800 family protein [Pseudoxanthomonas mexicana]UOV06892.1 DUF1800 family protein [Pseudoxanthomonas mexicana]
MGRRRPQAEDAGRLRGVGLAQHRHAAERTTARAGGVARPARTSPFTPRSPAGFADDAAEWSGADAVWKRIQAAQTLAESATGTAPDPLRTAGDVFGPHLDAGTALALRRAESPREGLALLFASPVFQWRS